MNQKGFSPIVIIASILTVLGLIGGAYYIGTLSNSGSKIQETEENNLKAQSIPSTAIAPQVSTPPFAKKLFDTSKEFVFSTALPKEVVEISDSQLVGIKCGEIYFKQNDGNFSYHVNNQVENPEIKADSQQLAYVDKARKLSMKEISDFQICQLEDGRSIGIFSEQLPGGGAGKDTYIGLIENQTLSTLSYIPHQPYAYFSCNQPLQMTSSNYFYIRCNAGDGGGGYSQINKVNLNNQTVVPIIGCYTQADFKMNSDKVTVECK